MWESVAVEYNASKERSWAARDFDSLRRKFRKLYAKPKPTGNMGDTLSRRMRAVLLAHETQYAIECKGGAHTSHDGRDDGADDSQLLQEVNSALNGDDDRPRIARTGLAPIQGDGHTSGLQNEGEVSDASPLPAENPDTTISGPVESPLPDTTSLQTALDNMLEPGGGARADSTGTVATSQGLVPVEFAADFEADSSDEEADEQDSQSLESSEVFTVAADGDGPGGRSNTAATTSSAPSGAASGTSLSSTPPPTSTPRAVGRPRVTGSAPIVSVATPDGSTLTRNPERVATDAAEAERFRRMNSTSDRLGGRDLRVLRDNFEEMGGRTPGTKSKRPATESTAPPTYAASKRARAKKRMDALEKELRDAELASASTSSDMKELLLLFRDDGDRRAEAEAKLRREEREERRADEKRERDERELVRREVAALAEARRLQDRDDQLKKLEAAERKEELERAERRDEEAERRRQFEARIELDRSEARQRHEQMLLLISSMQKGK